MTHEENGPIGSHSGNMALLYLIEALAGFSRGSYLVCFGWTTLIVTGDVAKVGQVFVVSMLSILIGSHFVGVIVDRNSRRRIIWTSHIFMASVMAFVGWKLGDIQSFDTGIFFAAVFLITLARIGYESSLEAILKQAVMPDIITPILARARAIHLLSTAIVTVFSGWCLSVFSTSIAFYFSAAFSIALSISAGLLPEFAGKRKSLGRASFRNDMILSFSLLRDIPGLALVVLLAGVALPIGQLSNAILSSFVHDDLGMGSWEFGLIDGAWPIGGLAASMLLSILTAIWARKISVGVTTGLVALSTIALACSQNVYLLAFLHGCMGFFTWLSRILVDARVLESVEDGQVGRAKSNVTFAFGFVAIVMCLSPTLVKIPSTNAYFLTWGAIILAVSILYGFRNNAQNKTIG